MTLGWFVTGTDTGIGKTTVSCLLLQSLFHRAGLKSLGMKPVATGAVLLRDLGARDRAASEALAARWPQWALACGAHSVHEDVLHLLSGSGALQASVPGGLTLADINPYGFMPAIAPHLAARALGVTLEFTHMAQALARLQALAEVVVVEGAGGFRVPLGAPGAGEMADLCGFLHLPLVLVVGIRLGCINHALLTLESIQARGLLLSGWIGNLLEPRPTAWAGTLDTLRERLSVPCLGVVPPLTGVQLDALYAGAAQEVKLPTEAPGCAHWALPGHSAPKTLLDVLDIKTLLASARR